MSIILDLDNHTFFQIIRYLDLQDMFNFSKTCKTIYQRFEKNALWYRLYKTHFAKHGNRNDYRKKYIQMYNSTPNLDIIHKKYRYYKFKPQNVEKLLKETCWQVSYQNPIWNKKMFIFFYHNFQDYFRQHFFNSQNIFKLLKYGYQDILIDFLELYPVQMLNIIQAFTFSYSNDMKDLFPFLSVCIWFFNYRLFGVIVEKFPRIFESTILYDLNSGDNVIQDLVEPQHADQENVDERRLSCLKLLVKHYKKELGKIIDRYPAKKSPLVSICKHIKNLSFLEYVHQQFSDQIVRFIQTNQPEMRNLDWKVQHAIMIWSNICTLAN